ncbi:MAG: single-stranded-DNA-specific exonuclease RecJ [Gemmatimonadaceae bacterium]|nr:single-stranded-DNA-specific exonuclease RecJ [Gemmatimonadaceae bacterium]NUQ92654.1 single-stranded-DNA-specific exonuclease RecJ [Gemmatimonadaceae bacterium]
MTASAAPLAARPAAGRPRPRWILPQAVDESAVAALVDALKLPPIICRLLVARGQVAPEDAKRYLRPRLEQLHEPSAMLDLDRAVERLAAAVRNREPVMVHGDYDVDGMCSTTILTRTIRDLGGVAIPFIPHRVTDGYDLSMAGVRAAIEAGAKVVVTCDCGTSAREPVGALCRAGIDVIVSDHHLPGGALPDCLAVLNPKRDGCEYPDKNLAAVGIAFKLALALTRALGRSDAPVMAMLDLVALATIADIAPLRGENRVMVRYGLRMLAETRNVGLRALIRAAGLDGKPLTAGRVGFILAPRLNAVGRLGHALRGVQLLLAETEGEANGIARELEELNRERQEIDKATLAQARQQLAAIDLDRTYGLVLASDEWHPGVIGIVASRIVEETGRPAVLVAVDEKGVGKGSGRSIPAFDLHAALAACREHLVRFGGHRSAAGITIDRARLGDFTRAFNDAAMARLTREDLVPELRVDVEIPLADASEELEAMLRHFEPFGIGNATPMLVSRGVRVASRPRTLKGEGLRVSLEQDGARLEALGWGLAGLAPLLAEGAMVDVAYRLERDDYKGEQTLQARLADIVVRR